MAHCNERSIRQPPAAFNGPGRAEQGCPYRHLAIFFPALTFLLLVRFVSRFACLVGLDQAKTPTPP